MLINYYKDKVAQPIVLLFLLAIAMPISFAIWTALLNNFVIQISNFSGVEIGWLQTIREIPGFLMRQYDRILFHLVQALIVLNNTFRKSDVKAN